MLIFVRVNNHAMVLWASRVEIPCGDECDFETSCEKTGERESPNYGCCGSVNLEICESLNLNYSCPPAARNRLMVCKVKLLFWSRFVIEKCAITFTTSSFGSKIPAMHYVTTYLSPVVLQSVCRRLHICALAPRHPCSICRTLSSLA